MSNFPRTDRFLISFEVELPKGDYDILGVKDTIIIAMEADEAWDIKRETLEVKKID
jgi:hypothetical protein